MAPASAPGSSGGTSRPVSPSAPTTSGSAPPVVATTRDAAGHRLDGRQGEPLVERGHHGHLGLAVEPGQLVVADPAHAVHGVGQPEPRDGPVDSSALVGPSDHGQLDLTFGAQLGHRLEQGHQSLHRDVAARGHHDPPRDGGEASRWAGRRCGPRRRARRSCARAPRPSAPRCPAREFCETVTTAGRARATRNCIPRKPNQRRVVKRCQGFVVCESASWRSTVIGWCRVVSSGHPSSTMPSIPLPRHWLSWTTSKSSRRSASSWRARLREGQRLPEAGGAHDAELDPVLARGELAAVRDPEGVRVPVQIQPGHGGESDPGVELGPGRAREDLDRVPQGDELAGQMAGVDALATTARVPTIGQVGDAQTPGTRRRGADRGGHLDMTGALPGLLGLDPLLAGGFRQRDVPTRPTMAA